MNYIASRLLMVCKTDKGMCWVKHEQISVYIKFNTFSIMFLWKELRNTSDTYPYLNTYKIWNFIISKRLTNTSLLSYSDQMTHISVILLCLSLFSKRIIRMLKRHMYATWSLLDRQKIHSKLMCMEYTLQTIIRNWKIKIVVTVDRNSPPFFLEFLFCGFHSDIHVKSLWSS